MVSWNFEESVETTATAEQVWAVWSNSVAWPKWDDVVEWVTLEGPFQKGSKGVMKPTGGPKVKFELQEVEALRHFRDRSFLPLTSLDFIHTYTPAKSEGKAKITHRVEMRGLLTPIFSRVIGKNVKKGLPGAMRKLIGLAEKS
jgi:hypothetical protein